MTLQEFIFWNSVSKNIIFTTLLLSLFYLFSTPKNRLKAVNSAPEWVSMFLFILVSLAIGLSPIGFGLGSDKENYANWFLDICSGYIKFSDFDKEQVFAILQIIISKFTNRVDVFFVILSFIYVGNHYLFIKKSLPHYSFVLLLLFASSFSFYSYGVNTIRAGLAASFLLLAIAYAGSWLRHLIFLFIAVGIHTSMAIPAIAMLLARFYTNTKHYYWLWLLSIPVSAVAGGTFESIFAGLGADDRAASYMLVEDSYYSRGFRIDFIVYSCLPVVAGYYYIFKRGYTDRYYSWIYNIYLIANTFWILVIRANFSDRFAYLSWFIYPIVITYPLFRHKFWDKQYQKLALIVFLSGLFTFIMNNK